MLPVRALHQVFGTSACQQQAGPFRIPAIGITVERRTDTIACDQGTEGHHAVRALIGKVLLCQRPELVLADVWIEPELCHGVRLHVPGGRPCTRHRKVSVGPPAPFPSIAANLDIKMFTNKQHGNNVSECKVGILLRPVIDALILLFFLVTSWFTWNIICSIESL